MVIPTVSAVGVRQIGTEEDHHSHKGKQRKFYLLSTDSPVWGLGTLPYSMTAYPSSPEKVSIVLTELITEVQLAVNEAEIQTQVCVEEKT